MKATIYSLGILLFWSCSQPSITFKVAVPKDTPINATVYISGDFENWSGGNSKYALQKKDSFYYITLPKISPTIQYKFTLGTWNTVEKNNQNNDIENRRYTFSKLKDTLLVPIVAWNTATKKTTTSTALSQVHVVKDSMYMPQLDSYRKILIYLPPNYEEETTKKYPVVYLQDGQNVFDAKTAYSKEWHADESLNNLYHNEGIEVIAVAIYNGGNQRMAEYSPYKNKHVSKPQGEAYVNFIRKDLKPFIDATYRTKTDAPNTGILGSSMGGLIAFYAAMKHPETFGKVGVFSPSFWISTKAYQLAQNNSKNNPSSYYFLVGKQEGDTMLEDTQKMVQLMQKKGFPKQQLKAEYITNGTHNESFWSAYFPNAIRWLFPIANTNKIEAKKVENAVLDSGTLYRVASFPSTYIAARTVDIWLPENYSKQKKYSVLYMHDGQNLFDGTKTWNKQEWKIDEVAGKLIKNKTIENIIVVGIYSNSKTRWQDLFPEKAYNNITEKTKKWIEEKAKDFNISTQLNGDAYLKYLVKEIKPWVDKTYATLPEKEHTVVAGSSMGGLMSMYAICEYPEVFSAAACVSTHWIGAVPIPNNPFPDAIFSYLKTHVPNAKTHKLYFDYGNKTLDKYYPDYAKRVDSIFLNAGYTNKNYKNLFFEGADHTERSWSKRVETPLTFLFQN